MQTSRKKSLAHLLKNKGATIPEPDSVWFDQDVNPDNIATNITVYPGCRIMGKSTSIGQGCVLGAEGTVTIQDCNLANDVYLGGGFFAQSVFMPHVKLGACAHIRPGCLLEEYASSGHAVGLKQTVLFPFVILGSLINFCDCLMAGGTSTSDHSEVGSSYIHFNYTPYGDKATASLFGDVTRGVLLDQQRVFLGGHGGTVGPCRVEYGTLVPAGCILRKDITEGGKIVYEPPIQQPLSIPFDPCKPRNLDRLIRNNLTYIGNITALRAWYRFVREPLTTTNKFYQACIKGAYRSFDIILEERISRLKQLSKESKLNQLASDLPKTIALETIRTSPAVPFPEKILAALQKGLTEDCNYVTAIRSLSPDVRDSARKWLGGIVKSVFELW